MDRRTYLGIAGGALTSGLAGCSSGSSQTTATTTTTTTSTTTTTTSRTTAAPADFELVSVSAPSSAEIGEKVSYSFTVKNTGGQTGTFETTISTRTGDGQWSTSEPWTRTIAPGESTTLQSQSFTYEQIISIDFRIDAFNRTFSIQFVGATLQWGETYKVFDRIPLTVKGVEFKKTYSTSSGYVYEAPAGKEWAFVNVTATNPTNTSAYLPSPANISVLFADNQYDYWTIYKQEGRYQAGQVQPDVTRSGWIAYQVPADLTQQKVEVVWSQNSSSGYVAAYWSSDGKRD